MRRAVEIGLDHVGADGDSAGERVVHGGCAVDDDWGRDRGADVGAAVLNLEGDGAFVNRAARGGDGSGERNGVRRAVVGVLRVAGGGGRRGRRVGVGEAAGQRGVAAGVGDDDIEGALRARGGAGRRVAGERCGAGDDYVGAGVAADFDAGADTIIGAGDGDAGAAGAGA